MRYLFLLLMLIYPTIFYAQPWAQQVKDICAGSCGTQISNFHTHNGKVYFQATEDTHGNELWVSDGTDQGTEMLKNISDDALGPAGSNPRSFCSINNTLLFIAGANLPQSTIWKTDGTESGTTEFGSLYIQGQMQDDMLAVDSAVYFVARDRLNINKFQFWKTDGTMQGTEILQDSVAPTNDPIKVATLNNRHYFALSYANEMVCTDGTPANTFIFPTPKNIVDIAAMGNSLYLYCDDGKLYKTATPLGGIQLISNLNNNTGKIGRLFAFDNRLIIIDSEIWLSDGTSTGTHKLEPYIIPPNNNPVKIGNKVYTTKTNLDTVVSIDKYGIVTTVSSNLQVRVNANVYSKCQLFVFNNDLYFEGQPITFINGIKQKGNIALYMYSTSKNVVNKIADITTRSSIPDYAILGNEMFIAATDNINGLELWKITDFPTSIESTSSTDNTSITLYPNPAQDHITLQLADDKPVSYRIINVYGQEVNSGTAQNNTRINIASLPAGVYTIVFDQHNKISANKVYKAIKQVWFRTKPYQNEKCTPYLVHTSA